MDRQMSSAELERAIGALADLPRADLIERWQELYRCDPPKGLSTQLMIRSMAYQMQTKRFGGLKPATVRKLCKFAGASNSSAEQRASVIDPVPWQYGVHALIVVFGLLRYWDARQQVAYT